jgi:hypothetical protein
LVGVDGEQDYEDFGYSLFQEIRGFNTVHLWHGKIHDHQVGIQFWPFLDSLGTMRGFAANSKTRTGLYSRPDGKANALAIINDEDIFRWPLLWRTSVSGL